MTVNEAITKLFSEYPDWDVISRDDIEAMKTLIEFTKE